MSYLDDNYTHNEREKIKKIRCIVYQCCLKMFGNSDLFSLHTKVIRNKIYFHIISAFDDELEFFINIEKPMSNILSLLRRYFPEV